MKIYFDLDSVSATLEIQEELRVSEQTFIDIINENKEKHFEIFGIKVLIDLMNIHIDNCKALTKAEFDMKFNTEGEDND